MFKNGSIDRHVSKFGWKVLKNIKYPDNKQKECKDISAYIKDIIAKLVENNAKASEVSNFVSTALKSIENKDNIEKESEHKK